MVLFVCCLLFMAAGTGVILQYAKPEPRVIIAENTQLRVSPFDSAAESGAVKNGKVVQLAKTYEGYIFIEGANGQSDGYRRMRSKQSSLKPGIVKPRHLSRNPPLGTISEAIESLLRTKPRKGGTP